MLAPMKIWFYTVHLFQLERLSLIPECLFAWVVLVLWKGSRTWGTSQSCVSVLFSLLPAVLKFTSFSPQEIHPLLTLGSHRIRDLKIMPGLW